MGVVKVIALFTSRSHSAFESANALHSYPRESSPCINVMMKSS